MTTVRRGNVTTTPRLAWGVAHVGIAARGNKPWSTGPSCSPRPLNILRLLTGALQTHRTPCTDATTLTISQRRDSLKTEVPCRQFRRSLRVHAPPHMTGCRPIFVQISPLTQTWTIPLTLHMGDTTLNLTIVVVVVGVEEEGEEVGATQTHALTLLSLALLCCISSNNRCDVSRHCHVTTVATTSNNTNTSINNSNTSCRLLPRRSYLPHHHLHHRITTTIKTIPRTLHLNEVATACPPTCQTRGQGPLGEGGFTLPYQGLTLRA